MTQKQTPMPDQSGQANGPQQAANAAVQHGSWLQSLRPLLWIVPVGVAVVVLIQVAGRQGEQAASAVEPAAAATHQSIRVVTAERRPIRAWVFAEGTARSVHREYLTFQMTGRVTFVGPEKEGQPVKQGDVLARLDKRQYAADVDAALAGIEEAKTKAEASTADAGQADTQLKLSRSQFNRTKQLHERNAATRADLEEAQAKLENAIASVAAAKAQAMAVRAQIDVAEAKLLQAKVALEQAEIVSPIDGIVAYLNVEEGYYFTHSNVKTASESEALQTIPMVVIDPLHFEISLDVPSYEAGRIAEGQHVLLLPGGASEAVSVQSVETAGTAEADPGLEWSARGEVYSVNPAVNPGGRSIRIKIRTTAGAEHLRDGMYVTCWIATREKADAIVVPFDAVLYEENRPYVFVYHPGTGTVERRDVQPGIRGLMHMEIAEGLASGEQLATDGRYRLVDQAPVEVLEPDGEAADSAAVHPFDQTFHNFQPPEPGRLRVRLQAGDSVSPATAGPLERVARPTSLREAFGPVQPVSAEGPTGRSAATQLQTGR